jgi:hypothetical protein
MDPKGDTAKIAEILSRDNEMWIDAVIQEANAVTHHQVTRRFSLPLGTWRQINQGVQPEASRTGTINENIGMLESYSQPDKALVDMAPDPAVFRMQEAAAFIEGMSQNIATQFIYGNSNVDVEKVTGLAPRMASLATTANVIGCSGTGSDLTSVYFVQWGEDRVFMVYPKGNKTLGIEHRDLGEVTVTNSDGSMFQAYRDHFKVTMGLVVKDPRSIARLCNIESVGTSNIFNEDEAIRLMNRMPMRGKGSVLYMNETVLTQAEIKLKDKTNVNFTKDEGMGGVEIMKFRGKPIRKMDAILNTESALT